MFSTNHFIWIALCGIFVSGMLFFGCKKRLPLKCAGYIMTVICACSEVIKTVCGMVESPLGGMHLDPRCLPFHLCSMMLFAVLFITFGKDGKAKQTVIDFVAVMGTLGSICAILIPTDGTDFQAIAVYQGFVYHAGLLWFSLYMIIRKEAHLGLRSYRKNVGILLTLVLIMLYINSMLSVYGTNFMFLVRPPMKNLPVLNLNHGWYVYFLTIVAIGMAVITLFHLPFILSERKSGKTAQ